MHRAQEMTTVMEGLLPLPAGVAANEALRERLGQQAAAILGQTSVQTCANLYKPV